MRLFYLLLLIGLLSCSSVYNLTDAKNPHHLPLNVGVVFFEQVVIMKGVKLDEFYRAARVWVRENKERYSLVWDQPIIKTTLLHTATIPASRISHNQSEYFANRTVQYLLTVQARNDSYRVFLSNFEVSGVNRQPVALEKLASDSLLCASVNRECQTVLTSLSTYIQKHSEKPL